MPIFVVRALGQGLQDHAQPVLVAALGLRFQTLEGRPQQPIIEQKAQPIQEVSVPKPRVLSPTA